MNTMRAVLVREPGGPEQLYLGEHPRPVPAADELLVRVHATALNRADLMQREGRYPPPPGASPVLGLEVAGTVEAAGERCTAFAVGDRVCGLLSGGGYAEYAVLHEDLALPIPLGLSFEEAAAIPEVFLTAYQALHWLGGIAAGDHVLIHAGASGVGTAALQLTRVAGAHGYATASSAKLEACRAYGAEEAIDYRNDDFVARVRAASGGHGADLIVDFIGAPYFEQNLAVLAMDGHLILLATMGGGRLDGFDLRRFFRKRARLEASTLRNRDLAYKARLTADLAAHVLPLFADATLRPVVDSVLDWKDVAEAHRYMGDNRNVGKIVLRVG